MLIFILFNIFANAEFSLDIESSKYIDSKVYLNSYRVENKTFSNYLKTGDNSLKVCFKNKLSKPVKIKNHVRVELKDKDNNFTDIVIDGALTSVKPIPVLSFYSLKSNDDYDWVCEAKIFTHNGSDNLYYYLANKELLLKKTTPKKVLTPKPIVKSNAVDKHQSYIKSIYKKIKNQKPKLSLQVKRNLRALIGTPKKTVSIIGEWRDKKTGVIYTIEPNLIKVSNMPNGFHMNYKKVGSQRLRVKVLNNSFDLIYKLKSNNEMLQKNTQSGLIRELIRL